MKIFLDTANLASIKTYNDMGLLDGITTNPSLLAKEGGDPQKTMEEIVRVVKGDVSLEVVSTEFRNDRRSPQTQKIWRKRRNQGANDC